jgi:hypothetical protein
MFLQKPKFPLGYLAATPGAVEAMQDSEQLPIDFLSRHARGDWGDVCEEDWDANEMALEHGYRLISSYETAKGERLWIITESDRSVTTILLPDEY